MIIEKVSLKPKVYIETSIPSYLTAWRSPDLVMAAKPLKNGGITEDSLNYFYQFWLFKKQVLVIQMPQKDGCNSWMLFQKLVSLKKLKSLLIFCCKKFHFQKKQRLMLNILL